MKTPITLSLMLIALTLLALTPVRAAESPPAKPRYQWDPEEFGIGRKHTANTRCNKAIDKLLEENRACYNVHPSSECEPLLKKNSKKMGGYFRSPRCAK